jgi:hypothetical protein
MRIPGTCLWDARLRFLPGVPGRNPGEMRIIAAPGYPPGYCSPDRPAASRGELRASLIHTRCMGVL